jgi:hypothetical protein
MKVPTLFYFINIEYFFVSSIFSTFAVIFVQ